MPRAEDLPHLLCLLDDDSPVVVEALAAAFVELGDDYESVFRSAGIPIGERHSRRIHELLGGLREAPEPELSDWERWASSHAGDDQRLEDGLGLVSWAVRRDPGAPAQLRRGLDGLAGDYRRHIASMGHPAAPHSLSDFLFDRCGFVGDREDYYAPCNSDLNAVLGRRGGNPISLACLYRLVGSRVGLRLGACNYPGHFMARVEVRGRVFAVDAFNGGGFIDYDTLRSNAPVDLGNSLDSEPAVRTVLGRVLANLNNAYARAGDPGRGDAFRRLARMVV